MSARHLIALTNPYLALLSAGMLAACGGLIGLDEYRIGDGSSGGGGSSGDGGSTGNTGGRTSGGGGSSGSETGGSGMGGAPTGGTNSNGGASGGIDHGVGGGSGGGDEPECTVHAHCEDDDPCTTSTCSESGECIHEVDEGCSAACDPASEVPAVILNANLPGNGSFEYHDLPEPGPWGYFSSDDFVLIFECPTNQCDLASNGVRYAWLGGADGHQDEIYQQLSLPSGARRLRIWADTNFQTDSTGATNNDVFEVWLQDGSGTPLTDAPLWRRTNQEAQLLTDIYTSNDIDIEFDLTSIETNVVRLSFQSVTDEALNTNFFFDNVRVTAYHCP